MSDVVGPPGSDTARSRYVYVLILGIGSGVVFLKTWLLSFLMSESQFADYNYYLVVSGVLALIAPLGLLLTCHTRLPGLLSNADDDGVTHLVGAAKSTIAVTALLALLIGTLTAGLSAALWLGVIQGSLFALFVIDQIVIKSRLAMVAYSANLLSRNLLIASAGIAGFWFAESTPAAMAGEAAATFVWCAVGGTLSWRWPRVADHARLVITSAPFALVTAFGTVLTMGDRALGARALDESGFALFSYYYLAVLAAMALQQAVNTRFMAVVALRRDPSANARDATRHAGIMFVLCALLACIVMVPLSLNDTYSTRTDTTLLILVAVLAGLRGADFFQAALLARGARVHVITAQLVYFAGLMLTLIAADGITQLLAGMVTAAAIYLTTVALLMWRLPPREVGRDDRI